MAASVQIRPQGRDLGMVMREVDEDLAIFLGIRRNDETEMNDHVLVDEFDDTKSVKSKPESLFNLNASQEETFVVEADDNFLNSEMEKSDTNWLVSQPDTPLLPSVEAEVDVQGCLDTQTKVSNGEAISRKSELENTGREAARKPARTAATPTGRPSLPAKPKATRSSTPISRSTLPSSKPMSAERNSSTPVGPTPRSSTPNSRPSIPIISKSTTRSATPTRKPTTSTVSSSSGRKTGLKSLGPSRGTSPTVKPRPSKPLEMLSVSHDASHNPKVSVPKRPVSASRARCMAGNSARSNEKPRRESCSPPRVRAPITSAYKTGSKILSRSRNDDVNPVVMGTKMVDRVVNMRKLAPPKQDAYVCHDSTRKSSHENSGFGRSLSKKSLDMAMRHMDIRRSVPDKTRAGSGKSSAV